VLVLVVVAEGGTARAGNETTRSVDPAHRVGPVEAIRDSWTPADGEQVSATVEPDGSWSFAGSWAGSPCAAIRTSQPRGKCRLQVVMALKGKASWFYFQEDSGAIDGDGVSWARQGKSKVLADRFADFAASGHAWTVAYRVLWTEVPPPSASFWGDIKEVINDARRVLEVTGPAITALLA
jgi:hypothetical protein